jgi:hypothetical protein
MPADGIAVDTRRPFTTPAPVLVIPPYATPSEAADLTDAWRVSLNRWTVLRDGARNDEATRPDGLSDAEWIAGKGDRLIAVDHPLRFGAPDGLTITERIKARNARLNAWRCAYHVAPGHPNRWQPKARKAAKRAKVAPVEIPAPNVAPATDAPYAATMLEAWEAPLPTTAHDIDTREDGNCVSRAMAKRWEAELDAESRTAATGLAESLAALGVADWRA